MSDGAPAAAAPAPAAPVAAPPAPTSVAAAKAALTSVTAPASIPQQAAAGSGEATGTTSATTPPATVPAPAAPAQEQPSTAAGAKERLRGADGKFIAVPSEAGAEAPAPEQVPGTSAAPAEGAAEGAGEAATSEPAPAPDGAAPPPEPAARFAVPEWLQGRYGAEVALPAGTPQEIVEIVGWSLNNPVRVAEVRAARTEAEEVRAHAQQVTAYARALEAQLQSVITNPEIAGALQHASLLRETEGDAVADAYLAHIERQMAEPLAQATQAEIARDYEARALDYGRRWGAECDSIAAKHFPLADANFSANVRIKVASVVHAENLRALEAGQVPSRYPTLEDFYKAAQAEYALLPAVQSQALQFQQRVTQEQIDRAAAEGRRLGETEAEKRHREERERVAAAQAANVHSRIPPAGADAGRSIDPPARAQSAAEAKRNLSSRAAA